MNTASAIIVAGVLIATAIVATNRYDMQVRPDQGTMSWRLNQLTGQMMMCAVGQPAKCFVAP